MNKNLTYIERLNNYLKQYHQIYGDTIYIDKTILLSSNIHKEKNLTIFQIINKKFLLKMKKF